MTDQSRQGRFLRDLAALPLKGGRVAIIGKPTRPDVPVTPGMLVHYAAWLKIELELVLHASTGFIDEPDGFAPWSYPVWGIASRHGFSMETDGPRAQRRAPMVLSAVGCPLTSPRAEKDGASTFEVHPDLAANQTLRFR